LSCENSIFRKGKWEYNGGSELVQSTLYICVELPQ
jgi:hypothetical protein